MLQHMRHRLNPTVGEDTEQLSVGSGGVGQWPQQIKHGSDAKFLARRSDMAHGSMMIGCEHETDAGFANAVFYCCGTDIGRTPKCSALERSQS